MKVLFILYFFLNVLVAFCCAEQQPARLLPGINFYSSHYNLSGRFIFLYSNNYSPNPNLESSSGIYEIDLTSSKIRKISVAPKGVLYSSRSGNYFCVLYHKPKWSQTGRTNVFIYSSIQDKHSIYSLKKQPEEVCLIGEHAFFTITDQGMNKIQILSLKNGQINEVRLKGASEWEYQEYSRIHDPCCDENILHFYYIFGGKKKTNGIDYKFGYYSYDILNNKYSWHSDLLNDNDNEMYDLTNAEGRFVFFQGSGAPKFGFNLVSSRLKSYESVNATSGLSEVKIIKKFGNIFSRNPYRLHASSPDKNFVLIAKDNLSTPKTEHQTGWVSSYYIVDVVTGKTQLILKNEVESTTSGFMSPLLWIP